MEKKIAKIAKIEEVTMFMELFGSRNDYGQVIEKYWFRQLKKLNISVKNTSLFCKSQ